MANKLNGANISVKRNVSYSGLYGKTGTYIFLAKICCIYT